MLVPALLAGGTAALGAYGQHRANVASAKMAREQMAFQERMSSTAYQRGVEDIRKAGLNPALAYQQGGASTPQGAKAEIASTVSPAVSSAVDTASAFANVRNILEQNNNLRAQSRNLDAQTTSIDDKRALEMAQLREQAFSLMQSGHLSRVQRMNLEEQLRVFDERFAAELELMSRQAESARASARASTASARETETWLIDPDAVSGLLGNNASSIMRLIRMLFRR